MATTTNLLITKLDNSTNQPEVLVNAALDTLDSVASGGASIFGRRNDTTTGLTWGYYGGQMMVDGVLTTISTSTLALTASVTNFVEATRAGVVSRNSTSFTAGQIPLFEVVTGASAITSYTDRRAWTQPDHITSKISVAVTSADVTLSAAQARCRHLTTTGVLTANRNVIVPNDWDGIVFCNNTGAFTTTFKTSGGTGIVVAQTKYAVLWADGTNVVRISPDT
jgi:hypothetical protein